jgi:hypothetical protein
MSFLLGFLGPLGKHSFIHSFIQASFISGEKHVSLVEVNGGANSPQKPT